MFSIMRKDNWKIIHYWETAIRNFYTWIPNLGEPINLSARKRNNERLNEKRTHGLVGVHVTNMAEVTLLRTKPAWKQK